MLESKSKYKINDHPYLVSTCYFKGRDYLVKMNISSKKTLEMKITDKHTSEDWFCSYDASYIENLTRKTGNYKQFSIFVAMLKSGLMKTSESVSLDLLTFNDLEALTTKRIMSHTIPNHPDSNLPNAASNRRYLILIYTVEFDRVHYPLPMEYCGPPDSQVLLTTIRRLEQEVSQLQCQLDRSESTGYEALTLQITSLEKSVHEVNQENEKLRKEVVRLNEQLATKSKVPPKFVETFQNSIVKLEEQVKQQRLAMKHHLDQFQSDRAKLNAQVEEYRNIEKNLLHELESLQRRPTIPVQQKRQSRLDAFNKRTQQKNIEIQPCISTQRKAPLFDGCPRRMTEPRNVSSSRRSIRGRSSSSDSSVGRSKREISPRCIIKEKSSSPESIHRRCKGTYCKRNTCSPDGDFSSTSSSSFVKSKTNIQTLQKKTKSKDSRNDFKISELERRVNALQQLLEKNISFT